jgi:hypothetical protein
LSNACNASGNGQKSFAPTAQASGSNFPLIAVENEETLKRYREQHIKREAPHVVSASAMEQMKMDDATQISLAPPL